MASEFLTLIVAGVGICGSLGGVILGQRLSRKGQREQWLLDRRAEEFRELLDALAASLRAAQITPGESGPTFIVLEPEQQKAIVETQAQTMRVIRSRVFVAEDVASLQIENRWSAALMKHNDRNDINKVGAVYNDIRKEIVEAAKTPNSPISPYLIGVPTTKLSGWKRVGIIASVVWIASAWILTYELETDSASKVIASDHVTCDSNLTGKTGDTLKKSFDECNKQADESLKRAIAGARVDAAVVAFVPVPFGWGLAYVALFLARWVKRGFPRAG